MERIEAWIIVGIAFAAFVYGFGRELRDRAKDRRRYSMSLRCHDGYRPDEMIPAKVLDEMADEAMGYWSIEREHWDCGIDFGPAIRKVRRAINNGASKDDVWRIFDSHVRKHANDQPEMLPDGTFNASGMTVAQIQATDW